MCCPQLSFDEAVAALTGGGVLVLPTDTLPGLHCRADLQDSVLRVAGLKGRDDGKPLLVLAGSFFQALGVCADLTREQEEICRACWPGPFSLILPAGGGLASRVTAGGPTVAVRVPRHPELQKLVEAGGFPLVSTSVNLQGQAPATEIQAAAGLFADQLEGWWEPGDGLASGTRPSALVDLTGDQPMVLREGPEPFSV